MYICSFLFNSTKDHMLYKFMFVLLKSANICFIQVHIFTYFPIFHVGHIHVHLVTSILSFQVHV